MWILRARYVSCYGVFHRSSVLFYLTWGSHNCRRLIHIHSETPPGVQSQPPQPLRASDTVCVALTGESLKLDSNIEEIISLKMAPQPLKYINWSRKGILGALAAQRYQRGATWQLPSGCLFSLDKINSLFLLQRILWPCSHPEACFQTCWGWIGVGRLVHQWYKNKICHWALFCPMIPENYGLKRKTKRWFSSPLLPL